MSELTKDSAPLFLPDTDDEQPEPSTSRKRTISGSDFELAWSGTEPKLAMLDLSDVQEPSTSSHILLPDSDTIGEPLHKKRKASPAPVMKDKKKANANANANASTSSSYYLGTIILGNAWSTVKGKGYIRPGDEIKVERDDQNDEQPPLKKTKGSKKPAEKKQITLVAMAKKQAARKKTDTVVRLTNKGGFEFGRLPTEVAAWVSKLLDMGIIEFKGSSMIECPLNLHSGADLIVSLSIYIRDNAFNPIKLPTDSDAARLHFSEGKETLDEQALRERKSSLINLFEAVNLKPQIAANITQLKSALEYEDNEKQNVNKPSVKKTKTEIVGDGEEVEVDEGEELSDSDLDLIYKRAQQHDQSLSVMEPAESFTLTLREYQKQALSWMHSLETTVGHSAREETSMHPLWSQYAFPNEPVDGMIDLASDETLFYFNPYSGELSRNFPKAERACRGGILADGKFQSNMYFSLLTAWRWFFNRNNRSVGMGKTIMLSSLIQTSLVEDEVEDERTVLQKARQMKLNAAFRVVPRKAFKSNATLIVAPTSLLNQWAEEIERSSKPGTFKTLVWHGQNRLDLVAATEPDDDEDKTIKVVVTSYGVLASEHAKSDNKQSPIFEINWLRVVLDEAHHCKSRMSKTAKAVYALKAKRRWAVTGTPIVNKLEDLYSLLKFLDFKPWSDFSFFRSFITLPFMARDPKAIEIVQVILESVLLRREKNMRDTDGKRIVDLPAKEVVIEHLDFSPLERKIYDSIYVDAKRQFERLNDKGLVGKNYTHILAMLMRLRRAVLHPNLVFPKDDNSKTDGVVDLEEITKQLTEEATEKNVFAEDALAQLGEDIEAECPICLDVMQTPMVIPQCMHQCCKDCIAAHLAACDERGELRRCPTCSCGPIEDKELLEVLRPKRNDEQDPTPRIVLRRNDFKSSTKLEALLTNLRRLRDQDPCFRAVVFSQFTSFLDLIQLALQREGLDNYRFDGSMDAKKRAHVVVEFKVASRKPKVMIISLKAGGVGLNLTTANHVFMMDCWWNAATENQAIDRVHRIGQEKTVYVKHFIVKNTIEGRILRIQKRKTAIVKEAFKGKGSGDTDPESLENLKIMFGDVRSAE